MTNVTNDVKAHRASIKSYPQAVMDYFGKKPDETTQEFMGELKALSDSDKADFRFMLKEIGYGL